jgi:hypothetical protein
VPIKRSYRRFCEALAKECEGQPVTWSVAIDTIAKRLGISGDEAIVLADDCHQAGLVRHDVPEHVRGRRLPHSVTLGSEDWKLLRRKGRAKAPGGRSR